MERAAEKNPDLKNQIVGICHGDDYESLEKVKKMLEIKCGCTRFMESYVGCAIGAHTAVSYTHLERHRKSSSIIC